MTDSLMTRSVVHILGTAQPEGTGIARIVAGLARGLKVKDYLLHAYFLGAHGPLVSELESAGVRTRVLDLHGWSAPGALRLWRALRGHEFSIVHQHAGGPGITRLARWSCHAAIALHLHGRVVESRGSSPTPIRVHRADIVIASSHSVAAQVVDAAPRVVYAGVPIPNGSFTPSSRTAKCEMIIGTGCRLVPIKGIQHLVRAFALLHAEFPEARLEIAGDGPERGRIAELVIDLGLQERVTLLGWEPGFAARLARWGIFVLPSLEEGFGIAAVEAMAAGLPVVASAVGGLPEIVQDGKTGWLVPPSNPAQLAERLRTLLLSPQERASMGREGRTRARTHFSEERMVAEIADIYDGLVAAR
jgi:glycosyltransferase involved in cell wall biosynthesis